MIQLTSCSASTIDVPSSDRSIAMPAAFSLAHDQWRLLLEQSRDALYIGTADLEEIFFVGPAFEQLWERSAQGLREQPQVWWNAIHPDDRQCVIDALPLIEQGRYTIDYRIIRSDGSLRWIHERVMRSEAADGTILHVGIAEDLGARGNIEARKHAEDGLRFLADASAILSQTLDYHTTLQAITKLAVPRIADYCLIDIIEEDEQIERVATTHKDPDKAHLIEQTRRYPPLPNSPSPLFRVLASGKPEFVPHVTEDVIQRSALSPEHLAQIRALGPRSMMVVPLIGSSQLVLGALSLMIVDEERCYAEPDLNVAEALASRAAQALENARLYAAEQRARREAEAAMQARDTFLAIASHELKTPLTALLAQAQLLERRMTRDGRLSDRDRRSLAAINEQAERLNRMISTLLDVSRLDAGQLSIERAPVDLHALARRVVETAAPTTALHTISYVGAEQPLVVDGDEVRLDQVLQNLVSNALKYSPDGGAVEVQVEQRGDRACVAVRDHGIGIPQNAFAHLFDRFYRVPSAAAQAIRGTGLGLYVVREIVALHGGAIEVESIEGVGSTFTVCLPLAK